MIEIKFTPKSNLGKWSVGLIVMVPILFYIGMSFVSFYEFIPVGKTILHDILIRPGIVLFMLAGLISGISAFFIGIIAVIKKKDCSILVFLSTVIGSLVLLWCLAEFLFPH